MPKNEKVTSRGARGARAARGERGARGARGERGERGRRGPAGPEGASGKLVVQLGHVLARVTQELEDVQRTLKVQFTRIAELQAELDKFRVVLEKSK